MKNSYDSIIVLANHMDNFGILNNESRLRVNCAIDALSCNYASILITCGWAYRKDLNISIAEAMRKYAKTLYSSTNATILTEANSRDTVGDALFTKINMALPLGWKKIMVVTSDYHVKRSRNIFTFVYGPSIQIDVIGTPCPHDRQQINKEIVSMAAFSKTFDGITPGDTKAIYERLRKEHPFYNGKIYKQIPKIIFNFQ